MNVIVTGASGLLGRAVVTEFKSNSWKVLGLAHTRVRDDLVQIDLMKTQSVASIVREFKPHAIIHCAAQRSPDRIEATPERFFPLNVLVPGELAKLACEVKAILVFISSDYVFSGENPPYAENALLNPLNEYGHNKAQAERAVRLHDPGCFILRIPVLYGGEETVTEGAISSLIPAIKGGERTEVSKLEIRHPSHTKDIAGVIYEIVNRKVQDNAFRGPVFHWCGSEGFTKYQMACMIADHFGLPHDHLVPVNDANPGAQRPMNCQLSCERLESVGIGRQTRFADGIEDFRKFFE